MTRLPEKRVREIMKATGQRMPDASREATPARKQWRQAEAKNNHGEVLFMNAWKLETTAQFPFERQIGFHGGRNWRFDFYDEATRTAVEIDGDVHSEVNYDGEKWANKRQQEADREKRNAAVEAGIGCLVFSVDEIENAPEKVISQVLRVLLKRRENIHK